MVNINSIFRYRPPKYLFDELKNQYFYLTPSYNENDINEGKPIFILKGNKYSWMGFFRFYYFFEYNFINFMKHKTVVPYKLIKGSTLFVRSKFIQDLINVLSRNKISVHFYQIRTILTFIKNTCDDYISLSLIHNSDSLSKPIKSALCVECYRDIINNEWANELDAIDTLLNINNPLTRKTMKKSKDIIYSIMMFTNRNKSYLLSLKRKYCFFNELIRLVIPMTYIVSFSDRYDNDEMWGNYADGYKGACLEYNLNESHLCMNNGSRKLFKVHYRNKLNKYNLFNCINPINLNNYIIFSELYMKNPINILLFNEHYNSYLNVRNSAVLSKTKDWAKEEEYRLLYFRIHLGNNRKKYYPFKMLKSVILGSQISLKLEMDIIALLQKKCNKYHMNGLKLYKINRQDDGSIDRDLLITFKDRSNSK